MKEKFRELKKVIERSRNVILTTHLIPDGDAIGSELAFYKYLKKKGKKVKIINHSFTPSYLTFLDPRKVITVFRNNKEQNSRLVQKADTVFVIDTNDYSRTNTMEQVIKESGAFKICIDHHLNTNKDLFDLVISDTSSPATSQLLFDFFTYEDVNIIDKDIATSLYAGIMTDTGSFRYPRTTEKTFLTAAELVRRGADPVRIYDKIFCNVAEEKVRLFARFIESLSFHYNGRVVIGTITLQDFKDFRSDVSDVEGFSSYIMSIQNVKIGFVIVELKDKIKLSFRSKGNIRVNLLAKKFGGGGHKNAAGATVFGKSVEMVKFELLNSLRYILD
ncbi:MAG: DHH family phosphoesterase [Ignavibacteria bacterium]